MAVVDPAEVLKHAASRRLKPIYLLIGDDVRAIEQVVDALEGTIEPDDRPFAVDRFYAGEAGASPIDIAAAARVFPMLGDRRIVVVMRAERILKPKRAAKTPEFEVSEEDGDPEGAVDTAALEEYVERPAESATLVFVAADVDRTRRLTKRVMEHAVVVPFAGLEGNDDYERREARRAVAGEMQREIEKRGRTIDQAALRMLVDRAGGDISKLRGDVERLLLFTEGAAAIGLADVEEIAVIESSIDDEWAVVNAIADGDAARALRQTALRLDRGDSVHALVGQLRWWVSSKMVQMSPARVRPAIESLLRTDLALKSSGGDERVLIERLVVELSGR